MGNIIRGKKKVKTRVIKKKTVDEIKKTRKIFEKAQKKLKYKIDMIILLNHYNFNKSKIKNNIKNKK